MINLTNFEEHPTRKAYTVFHFLDLDRASYFESQLIENNVWFEKEIDTTSEKTIYLFGIKNTTLKQVKQYNYLVSAKYRKPIIPSKAGRWALYVFTILLLVLIIGGYLNAKT